MRENILYGNGDYDKYANDELKKMLEEANLTNLLSRFSDVLDTRIVSSGDAISLGQKQLLAFM